MNKDKEVEAYKSGNLTPEEQTKYEIAQELGILDKVLEGGWKSLSAKETGRIGGIMARKIIVYYLPLQLAIRLERV